MTWQARAACRTSDPELFFPIAAEHPHQQTTAAKAVCRSCPVTDQCLGYALSHGERGIWGGTTERERDTLIRNARAQAVSRR